MPMRLDVSQVRFPILQMLLISNIASVGIEAITGPEVVTGSTRMKAGTAQKSFSLYDYNDCNDSSRKNFQRIYGRCSTNEPKVENNEKQYSRRSPIFLPKTQRRFLRTMILI